MLKLTTLPASPGRTQSRYGGICRAGRFTADARAHALGPKLPSRIRLALFCCLLSPLACLTSRCTPARTVPTEAHATTAEHAEPTGKEWRKSQYAND